MRERYGIEPEQVPDFIALRGDPSDGLPGAKGIGAKTARDLLREHGTLEGVIAAAAKPGRMTPRQAGALTGDPDALRAFKDIATLRAIDARAPRRRAAGRRRSRRSGARARHEPPRRAPRGLVLTCYQTVSDAPGTAGSGARLGHHVGAVRLLSALAVAVALVLVLPGAARAADPPGPVSLSQGWDFAPDPTDQGTIQNWQSGLRGTRWEPATIPHVLDARTEPRIFRGSVGWYRLTFQGPRTRAGLGWALRFEQVRRIARVWLNGQELGVHRGPYTPFELPATGLRAGVPNTLVVRVDYRRQPGLREGWWNWGGITRPVSLVARGPVVMHDAGLLPQRVCVASACAWNVLVDGWVENSSGSVQSPAVSVRLQSPDGTISQGSATARPLQPGERVRVRFAVPVARRSEAVVAGEPEPLCRHDLHARRRAGGADRSARASACAPSRSSTGCCASTGACSICAGRRCRRTSPAAGRR